MKKFVVGFLALIGFLAILAVIVFAGFGLIAVAARPGVPRSTILEVDFEQGVLEAIPDDPFAEVMLEHSLEIRDVVDALDRAATDDRIRAFVAWIGGETLSMAHVQEIRDAVMRFRRSGKPTVAFAETFGEFAPGNGAYYLATAFEEVYLQPSGDVGLAGLMYETMFLRGMFDKLGVEPRMGQRYEYKNAMNMYTEREFTEPHREALERVMESRFEQIVRGISEARGIAEEELRKLIDRGPFLADEALAAGLIDGLLYRDEVLERLREQAGNRSELLYLARYLERVDRPNRRGETVALIHGHGTVARGPSRYSPLTGAVVMGSDSVAAAFRGAIEDDRVRAILFRVDSPGGSYVASDTIRREVVRAREAGKPVVVSMGNLAGSGGYFVAMDADRIVAEPSTITASIGVLGGKLVTRGFWDKLGITWDEVHSSSNAPLWTSLMEYDSAEYERLEAGLDRIYEDFTRKVAEGRHVPLERVQELARGRIWSGEDARALGLGADDLGGFHEALVAVREVLELEQDAPLRLKPFPPKRSPFEQFLGQRPENSERAAIGALAHTLKSLQPKLRMLERLGLSSEPEVLAMPEWARP